MKMLVQIHALAEVDSNGAMRSSYEAAVEKLL